MRHLIDLMEATSSYVRKQVDPALMTLDEYRKLVDPDEKSHPDSAYDWSIADKKWRPDRDRFSKLLRRVKINGIYFEFRLQMEDRADGKVTKTTPEGDVVRDQNGNALYWTREELLQRLPPSRRYEYTIGVFTDDDGYIGGAQDEWGTMLIHVAREYRGFGLGPILGKIARGFEPGKKSGGFTRAGMNNFIRVHREMVRDYVASGMYSHLVKTGQITAERAKAIIASARLENRPGQKINSDLGSNNPSDWLLMVGEHGDFYLYDRKLKDIYNEGDAYDHWREKMVKGMVYVEVSDDPRLTGYGRIKAFGGDTPKIKSFMLLLAAAYSQQHGADLMVEPDDLPFVDQKQMEIVGEPHVRAGYKAATVRLKGAMPFAIGLGMAEERFRKAFDRYGEFKDTVQTLAYGKYQSGS